jgi:hypothetical protein
MDSYFNWLSVRDVLSAAYVTTLIAIVGAVIASLQLRYTKRRDAELDLRNQWEKIHKAMLEFRFHREILNMPTIVGQTGIFPDDIRRASRCVAFASR